jgi:hypothetical protein
MPAPELVELGLFLVELGESELLFAELLVDLRDELLALPDELAVFLGAGFVPPSAQPRVVSGI